MFIPFSKEFILAKDKTITTNNCWIPNNQPSGNGYVSIAINCRSYLLHRTVMCLWNNVDYYDPAVLALHNCNNRACFNPEHLRPGNQSENIKDSVLIRTHPEAKKRVCPKCGFGYSNQRYRNIYGEIAIRRRCRNCVNRIQRAKREEIRQEKRAKNAS